MVMLYSIMSVYAIDKDPGHYKAKPLSGFLGNPAPAAAPAVDWPKIDKTLEKTNPFGYLAFLLQFAPTTGSAAVEAPPQEVRAYRH